MKKLLIPLVFAVAGVFATSSIAHALHSTDNLKKYERNLDTLSDKDGSLSELIGELQGFDVFVATNGGVGSQIVNASVGEDDTILKVVVLSSANIVVASSVTLRGTNSYWGGKSEALTLKSKIAGTMGNNISVSLIQETSSRAFSGALTVVTTGYAIDIHLSSAGVFNIQTSTAMAGFASAGAVKSAIEASASANDLISCEVTCSTNQVVVPNTTMPITLTGGQGSALAQNVISGDHFTCANGYIIVGSHAPVSANDMLVFYIYHRP